VTWGGFDDERVEALDLPFEVIHAGTDAALFAELESAYQRQGADHAVGLRPALGTGQVQGRMGRIPGIHRRVLQRSRLGHQQSGHAAYDCGKPFGEIWKVGWAGVKDKWPGAYERSRHSPSTMTKWAR
jgi:glycine betaine/proline transport system substrate-binding protein